MDKLNRLSQPPFWFVRTEGIGTSKKGGGGRGRGEGDKNGSILPTPSLIALSLTQTLDLTQGRAGMWPTTEQGPRKYSSPPPTPSFPQFTPVPHLDRYVVLIPGFIGSPIQDGGRDFSARSQIRLFCWLGVAQKGKLCSAAPHCEESDATEGYSSQRRIRLEGYTAASCCQESGLLRLPSLVPSRSVSRRRNG